MTRQTLGVYPTVRMRRGRQNAWMRRLMRENRLSVDHLVWPVFVQEGRRQKTEVASMPGVFRFTVDRLSEVADEAKKLGIPAIAIFPVIDGAKKTIDGREATNPDNLACRALSALKSAASDIGIIADVALDPFTSHGQDGILRDGEILNDETIDVLCEQAVIQAEAGADIIAPSDMMDGRIGKIRNALDARGLKRIAILSYAAKYASAFYGPFRDAVGSGTALGGGDKKTYQMDPANGDEALREVALDVAEGADLVMVKPGMPYLDILWRVKEAFGLPTAVYHVSGEYAMICAAAKQGWIDGEQILMETMIAFRRAGADLIFTYAAPDVARLIG